MIYISLILVTLKRQRKTRKCRQDTLCIANVSNFKETNKSKELHTEYIIHSY